jgi:hypothetical protein
LFGAKWVRFKRLFFQSNTQQEEKAEIEIYLFWGGFHEAIYAVCLEFVLCAHLFSLINHHVLAPYNQLIAFSPRFGWALCFTPCAQLLWNLFCCSSSKHIELLKLSTTWTKSCFNQFTIKYNKSSWK